MNENLEIVTHIYKDSEMSISSLKKLNTALENKDNKIKNMIEEILQGYEEYFKKAKKILTKGNGKKEKTGLITKVMANMGIDKEVKDDNSDSAIADLLIKGIMMGTVDLEKKIKKYEDVELNEETKKIVEDFQNFQNSCIEKLRCFL